MLNAFSYEGNNLSENKRLLSPSLNNEQLLLSCPLDLIVTLRLNSSVFTKTIIKHGFRDARLNNLYKSYVSNKIECAFRENLLGTFQSTNIRNLYWGQVFYTEDSSNAEFDLKWLIWQYTDSLYPVNLGNLYLDCKGYGSATLFSAKNYVNGSLQSNHFTKIDFKMARLNAGTNFEEQMFSTTMRVQKQTDDVLVFTGLKTLFQSVNSEIPTETDLLGALGYVLIYNKHTGFSHIILDFVPERDSMMRVTRTFVHNRVTLIGLCCLSFYEKDVNIDICDVSSHTRVFTIAIRDDYYHDLDDNISLAYFNNYIVYINRNRNSMTNKLIWINLDSRLVEKVTYFEAVDQNTRVELIDNGGSLPSVVLVNKEKNFIYTS